MIGPIPGIAHQPLAVRLRDLLIVLDLTGDGLDALVEPQPIFIKADNDQIVHARRYLVGTVLQEWQTTIYAEA